MVCTQTHTHMHSTHTFDMGVEGDILDIWIWVDMGGYGWRLHLFFSNLTKI